VLHEHIGFPLSNWSELQGATGQPGGEKTEVIRVLHSPSSTVAKGTVEIESVISSLQASGLPLKYERLSGVPNSAVISKITQVDFVIDQLYADSAAGVFAAESSLLGRAVVIGVIDKDWLCEFLKTSTPPTCIIHPIDLEKEILKLSTDVEYRLERASAAKSYFGHLWSPVNVARNYASLLENGELGHLGVDPKTIYQARGGFATVEQISDKVTDYVRRFGVRALGLGHNSNLEEQVLKSYFRPKGRSRKK
jgi:hypothetical protein